MIPTSPTRQSEIDQFHASPGTNQAEPINKQTFNSSRSIDCRANKAGP
jgi:hypothetical protein